MTVSHKPPIFMFDASFLSSYTMHIVELLAICPRHFGGRSIRYADEPVPSAEPVLLFKFYQSGPYC